MVQSVGINISHHLVEGTVSPIFILNNNIIVSQTVLLDAFVIFFTFLVFFQACHFAIIDAHTKSKPISLLFIK